MWTQDLILNRLDTFDPKLTRWADWTPLLDTMFFRVDWVATSSWWCPLIVDSTWSCVQFDFWIYGSSLQKIKLFMLTIHLFVSWYMLQWKLYNDVFICILISFATTMQSNAGAHNWFSTRCVSEDWSMGWKHSHGGRKCHNTDSFRLLTDGPLPSWMAT